MGIDERVAALARSQAGVVARRQLVALGMSESALGHRLGSGRLRRVERGVYAPGGAVLGRAGVVWAAVLSCGPGAVAGHRDAAWAWGLATPGSGKVHVCVTGKGGGRRPTLHLHRGRGLRPADLTTADGIPVTTLARTLLDEAARTTRGRLTRMVGEAEHLGLYDHAAVLDVLTANPRHPGARSLALVTAAPALRLRSDHEAAFAAAARDRGLTALETNVVVGDVEVDVLFRAERVVVEIDTPLTHATTFESDRRRDRALTAAGYVVLRVAGAELSRSPGSVLDEVCAVVEGRR